MIRRFFILQNVMEEFINGLNKEIETMSRNRWSTQESITMNKLIKYRRSIPLYRITTLAYFSIPLMIRVVYQKWYARMLEARIKAVVFMLRFTRINYLEISWQALTEERVNVKILIQLLFQNEKNQLFFHFILPLGESISRTVQSISI